MVSAPQTARKSEDLTESPTGSWQAAEPRFLLNNHRQFVIQRTEAEESVSVPS